MKRSEIQTQFYKEKGIEAFNSQGEPDIDYVEWLEKLVSFLPVSPTVEEKPDGYIYNGRFYNNLTGLFAPENEVKPVYFSPVSPSEKTIEMEEPSLDEIQILIDTLEQNPDRKVETIRIWFKNYASVPKLLKTIDAEELLNKIFDDLEKNAFEPEFYKYWIKQTNQIIRKHITEYLSVSSPELSKTTDMNKLRKLFFEECTGHLDDSGLKKVNMAPHDLFEWFKRNLSATLESVKIKEEDGNYINYFEKQFAVWISVNRWIQQGDSDFYCQDSSANHYSIGVLRDKFFSELLNKK